MEMERDTALHFRDQLKAARAVAARDAEGFQEIIFALEGLGSYLSGERRGLGAYFPELKKLAAHSPMANEVPAALADFHQLFDAKYHIVREGRNSALHEGAIARHLTVNAAELSLILEEAIMNELNDAQVSDFMVRNPVCACLWQPLSFIRQTMLVNSFSYLPVSVEVEGRREWRLISDFQLATFLRKHGKAAKDALIQKLSDIVPQQFQLLPAPTCGPQNGIEEVLKKSNGMPTVVLSSDGQELLGIVTPFDFL